MGATEDVTTATKKATKAKAVIDPALLVPLDLVPLGWERPRIEGEIKMPKDLKRRPLTEQEQLRYCGFLHSYLPNLTSQQLLQVLTWQWRWSPALPLRVNARMIRREIWGPNA